MCAPDMPSPPDPQETASAQTGTNIGTAIANTRMGMVNQNTPYGSLTYNQIGSTPYTDEYTGQTYDIPQFEANTVLDDVQMRTLDQSNRAKMNLSETANERAGFLQDYLSKPMNTDTSAIEGRLSELARQRMDPRFERQREALESRLANQGLQPGSAAWEAQMGQFGETQNDAYNQLMLTGRTQARNEIFADRVQPLNEINSLLGSTQVQNPNVSMAQPYGAATTDVAGLINNNFNQRAQNGMVQYNHMQGTLGGLFGFGAGLI